MEFTKEQTQAIYEYIARIQRGEAEKPVLLYNEGSETHDEYPEIVSLKLHKGNESTDYLNLSFLRKEYADATREVIKSVPLVANSNEEIKDYKWPTNYDEYGLHQVKNLNNANSNFTHGLPFTQAKDNKAMALFLPIKGATVDTLQAVICLLFYIDPLTDEAGIAYAFGDSTTGSARDINQRSEWKMAGEAGEAGGSTTIHRVNLSEKVRKELSNNTEFASVEYVNAYLTYDDTRADFVISVSGLVPAKMNANKLISINVQIPEHVSTHTNLIASSDIYTPLTYSPDAYGTANPSFIAVEPALTLCASTWTFNSDNTVHRSLTFNTRIKGPNIDGGYYQGFTIQGSFATIESKPQLLDEDIIQD